MNGSKFHDFFFGKAFLLLFILLILASLIPIFLLFSGMGIKIDYTIIYPILIVLVMIGVWGVGMYLLFRRMGIHLSSITNVIKDKKEVARSYGLSPKRADSGLMYEADFYLDPNEVKIRFYPAIWCIDSNRRYSEASIARSSVMITNKRIMIGPGPFSFYFPSKSQKDDHHYWLNDIEIVKYLFFIKGCLLFFQVPERLAGSMRFLPTRRVTQRKQPGYVVDGLYLFPKDIADFIDVINKAQS